MSVLQARASVGPRSFFATLRFCSFLFCGAAVVLGSLLTPGSGVPRGLAFLWNVGLWGSVLTLGWWVLARARHALFAHAFALSPYGVIVLNRHLRYVSSNARAQELFCSPLGLSPLSVLEQGCTDMESQNALERLKVCAYHQEEGKEWLRISGAQGIFGVMVTVKRGPVAFGKRSYGSFWFIEIDPTPLEGTLASPILKHILEASPSPIVVTSRQGQIRYANLAFLEWLGWDETDVIGKPLSFFSGEPASGVAPQLLSFKHRSGQKHPGVITSFYTLPGRGHEVCLFVAPQTLSPGGEGEIHLGLFVESIPLPALFLDHRGVIRLTNRHFEKVVRERKILGRPLKDWLEDDEKSKLDKFLQQTRRERDNHHFLGLPFLGRETSFVRFYGTHITSLGWDPLGCYLIVLYDLSEIKKRENQTLESQKLQALGQLASGISHDFNNLLTAMLGFCDLLLQRHSPQDNSFTDIMQIKQNANRAANLVRQLLLFAKQTPPNPKPLDLRECLNEMSFLLRRLIGPKIELDIKHDRGLRMIHADQGQIEQIIMNLAINARDAMAGGGLLTFRTRTLTLKEPLQLHRHLLVPKMYVVIEVVDTGCGIPPECIEKIFDPFFSTKEPGRGTGLGLATVYQILESMNGGVAVTSEVGKGTTFLVYLPRYLEKKKRDEDKEDSEEVSSGHLIDFWESATVLLVEDEDPVRLFASRALKSKGYEVLEAKNGAQGFEVLQKNPHIRLLITDVMMPGMDGPALVNAAYELNHQLKVMFVSGYPEEDIQTQLRFPKEQVYFLPKPFNLSDLTVKVHEVLGQ